MEPRQHGDFVAGQAVGPYWHTDELDSSLFYPVVAHAGAASTIINTEGEATVGCRPCAGLRLLSLEESPWSQQASGGRDSQTWFLKINEY